MKKVLIVGLALVMSLALGSAVMAGKKGPQIPCPPLDLTEICGDEDKHCFDWEPPDCGKTPTKYSLDVELLLDGEGWDEIAELSFGTSDRTDGGEHTDTDLCIPISSFVVYNTMTEQDEQFEGPARIKVKALAKGKKLVNSDGSSDNAFSTPWLEFEVGSTPSACSPASPTDG